MKITLTDTQIDHIISKEMKTIIKDYPQGSTTRKAAETIRAYYKPCNFEDQEFEPAPWTS